MSMIDGLLFVSSHTESRLPGWFGGKQEAERDLHSSDFVGRAFDAGRSPLPTRARNVPVRPDRRSAVRAEVNAHRRQVGVHLPTERRK
jgi:hypothetical protein